MPICISFMVNVSWREILRNSTQDPQFTEKILFTDEALFTGSSIFNSHNTYEWSDENPHCIKTRKYQHTFAVNLWVGIVGHFFIVPYTLA